jgi:hypothetical protein
VNRCTRYDDTGVACRNQTNYEDGWCRSDGCAGFTRPSGADAPKLKDVKFYGTPEEIKATGANPATIECAPADLVVWPQALRQFKFHHGGTDDEAKVQMRWMLSDFLDKSGRVVSETNYLVLSRDGYRLHIAPSRNRITGYTTVHRERTWEQFKRGIPSRIGPIEAAPMPLLASLKPSDMELAAPKNLEPLRLDLPKPVPNKPTAPKPGSWKHIAPPVPARASDSVAVASAGEVEVSSVAPESVAPPAELVPPPTSPMFTDAVDSQTKPDSDQTAGRAGEPHPEAVETPRLAKPIERRGQEGKSGPSTLTTAAVSILSTLVAVRAVRWFTKDSNR